MKKKWYRGRAAKAALIIAAHITAIVTVLCGLTAVYLFHEGFSFKDSGKTYVQSQRFENDIRSSANKIIQELKAQSTFPSADSSHTKIIELDEGIPGLSYYVDDLLNWAKESWDYNTYSEGRNVLKCINTDGTYTYLYYNDFKQKLENEKLTLASNDNADDEVAADILEQLKYGQISENGTNSCTVKDTQGNTIFVDVFAYPMDTLKEKYAPVGASSILEVLNKNPKWNDRIDEAYRALEEALVSASHSLESSEALLGYREGNTNLAYLYIDKDNQRVLTNENSYEDYQKYNDSLEEIKSHGMYFIIYPQLLDCETNFPSHTNDGNPERTSNFQAWHHIAEANSISGDYIFAVQVDTEFPISDSIANNQYHYDKYSKWLRPAVIVGAFTLLIFLAALAWLTKAAGRRPEDEEIHLCPADRIYPEMALVLVILWFGVTVLFARGYRLYTKPRAYIFSGITAGYTTALFLTAYLSLVRRIKAKILWKKSLLCLMAGKSKGWIKVLPQWLPGKLHSIGKRLKSLLEIFTHNTGSKTKTMLFLGGILLLEFIVSILFGIRNYVFFVILLVADAAIFIYALRKADGREKLLDGLKRISSGELQYKIPLNTLSGEQKIMGEYINNIGAGLDAAVENSLKNERMKTELITNVSHDIKTPLTSIINYVGLLKRENFTDEKICGYLDILEEKALRLKVLTEDVVEASKASTGNITLEMTDLDFVEMLHQVIGEFEEKFRDRSLTMVVHFTDEPSVIYADGQHLWRVLENIFNNAVKYAMEGTRVYAEVNKADQKVIFTLKNISAQPLNISADELTERFIRGDVSRNTEGSGLGLSIAKSLTELQGGEFNLYVDGDLFKVTITFAAR